MNIFKPCKSCTNYNYRKDFCSPKCFQEYMKKGYDIMKEYPMINPVRGKIFDGDKMVDILYFDFETLENHKFIDHYNIERNINDFHHIILYREAFIDILKNVRDNAYKDGYNECKKNKRKLKKDI